MVMVDWSKVVDNMDKARGEQLDHKGVVVVYCYFVVLPCRVFDGRDRVGGFVENFVGSVDMGGCYSGVVEGCEVEPRVAPMGGLHSLGRVSLPQDV